MKLIKTLLNFGKKQKVQQLGRWNLDKSKYKIING